jgi:hypothetical protein
MLFEAGVHLRNKTQLLTYLKFENRLKLLQLQDL